MIVKMLRNNMARQFKIEVEDHVFVAIYWKIRLPTCEAFWNALPL